MPFLDWVNKTQAVNIAADVPYHLLKFQSVHGDAGAENLLIQGDNLLALKALLPFYRGKVKCIYIDPPYNTQSAFTHYDDKLEHSQWLTMMYPRLVLLRELLAEDGSIWVSIDDREAHYLKVLMDEVFGRGNFVTTVCWEKIYTLKNTAKHFSEMHDFVLVYAKCLNSVRLNPLPRSEKQDNSFKNPDNDPRGPWLDSAVHARNFYSKGTYTVTSPSGKEFTPPPGRYWAVSEENFKNLEDENKIWWGKEGKNAPRKKTFLTDVKAGVVPGTIWFYSDAGQNAEAKNEIKALFADNTNIFITPKPERLIQRILHIATNPDDLVLDSFLGSGTTAAVAHKMGRRWIGIEMGEHAVTHCLPRLEKVIDGEQGGISKAVNWQGGGGFRFHTLGEPVFDADGGIHPNVRFTALAGYLWHFETGEPWGSTPLTHRSLSGVEGNIATPLLGIHNKTAYYLLYNGILGDRRPQGGNVLTSAVLAHLDETYPHQGPRVIYGETTRLGEARLREAGITFKQIPYDIKAR